MLNGPQAFELGIADAMFEPADFLEQSLRLGRPACSPATSPVDAAAEVDRDDAAWDGAVEAAQAARRRQGRTAPPRRRTGRSS